MSVGQQSHCSETASMWTCSVVFVSSVHCKNIMSGIAGVQLQVMAQTGQKEDQVIQSGPWNSGGKAWSRIGNQRETSTILWYVERSIIYLPKQERTQ